MDLLTEKPPAHDVNGPIEYSIAYGHIMKLQRVISKDKLNNVFTSNCPDNDKKNSRSKLPRVVKTPLNPNNSVKPCGNSDDSGVSTAGSSKLKYSQFKTKKQIPGHKPDKIRGSHIPRRRALDSQIKNEEIKTIDNTNFANEAQRIQRLHVPNIIPDFHQENIPPSSIGSTRPIPTLGQIYRQNNIIIDGDRFYDWFMELDAPVNSLESNPRNTLQRVSNDSTDTAQSFINVEIAKPCFGDREKPQMVFGANVYKTTNDNISDWLASEADYSNRDNESGYRSMSPHSRGVINIQSKHSDGAIVEHTSDNCSLGLGKTSERFEASDTEREPGVASGNNIDNMPLVQQPTIVISKGNEGSESQPILAETTALKTDVALEPIVFRKLEFSKNVQFPSITQSKLETQAPSYVECPSEILQKTTNFEMDGCESPNALSSLAGTDQEIRDDYASQYALENVDDCNLEDHPSQAAWCTSTNRSSSCTTLEKSGESNDTTRRNSCFAGRGDSHDGTTASVMIPENCGKRYYCHSCGKQTSHPLDNFSLSRKQSKKHFSYNRFPSHRYKASKPLDSLRKRLSFRGICRRRWNNVWKKTVKWTSWSKSRSKLGKANMLSSLLSSIIWEDMNIQTTPQVYQEIGTHTMTMEQKSTAIATSVMFSTSTKTADAGGTGTSTRSFKSRFKNINLGPSRFPFFYNSKRKSMPAKSVEEASKTVQKFYSYPEYCNNLNENSDTKKIAEKSTSSEDIQCENYPKKVPCCIASTKTSPINILISEKQLICECSANTDKYTSNEQGSKTSEVHQCQTSTDSNFIIDKKTVSKKSVIAECPTNADINLLVLDRPKTIEQNTGTEDFEEISPMDKRSIYSKANGSILSAKDACTEAILTSRNIETDMSSALVCNHSLSVGTNREYTAICQPCGTNTDSWKLELSSDQIEKKSVQLMTSQISFANAPPKSESAASTRTFKQSRSVEVNISNEEPKIDSATVTSLPELTNADEKVTSMSSARRLTASAVTSPIDISATVEPRAEMKVCLMDQTTSTYKEEMKQTQSLSTQDLLNKRCQSKEFADMGTTTDISTKSACIYIRIDKKSAYAVTSTKKTQSNEMVTSNEEDPFDLKRVSTSTNKGYNAETKSRGHSALSTFMTQPDKKPTIDTWVQYSHNFEQNDNYSLRSPRIGLSKLITSRMLNDSTSTDKETEPVQHPSRYKSMSMMTSTPFNAASNTTDTHGKGQTLVCACAEIGCDMETNTQSDLYNKINTECSTQVFRNECNQSIDKATCSSCGDNTETLSSTSRNKQTTADKLSTLSRLIGREQSGSQITSNAPQPITSTIISSNLDADKWIKRCTQEKDYQSQIESEQSTLETLKQASWSLANTHKSPRVSPTECSPRAGSRIISKSNTLSHLNTVPIPSILAVPILSDDSLADVLPTGILTKETLPEKEHKTMADKNTSDEVLSKTLRESKIQTRPDLCDAAILTMMPNANCVKSASAITSRCVLPSPSVCRLSNRDHTGCLFVYDKPRCAVHQTRVDVSVQISDPSEQNAELDKKPNSHEHAIGQVENVVHPCPKTPSCQRRRPSINVIGEVLPPKVYKALYETAKMAARESNLPSVENAVPVIDNEAAIIRALAIRSAAILTSSCGLSVGTCHCKNDYKPSTNKAQYVFSFNTPASSIEGSTRTQTCSNCHAKLLEIPPSYYESEFLEEHVRTQLVGSCRYYSNLLSQRFGSVKEKFTKHLAPPSDDCTYVSNHPKRSYTEACTMKPSGREHFGSQTIKNHITTSQRPRTRSCCTISPCLTNICSGTEKNQLRSVYYMLSAIEGRIRRLNRNIPN